MLRILREFHSFLILLLMLTLTACDLPSGPLPTFTPSPVPHDAPGVRLTMLLPGNGAVLSLRPTAAYVHFDGSEASTHPQQLHLVVNGTPVDRPFDYTSDWVDFKQYLDWTPDGPGEYLLQAEAIMPGGDVARTPVTRVCVLDVNPEMFGGGVGDGSVYGYNGPCQIPTRLPPQSSGQLGMTVLTSPAQLTFRTPNQPTCIGKTRINITFVATVTDPADDIIFVRVLYQFIDNAFAFPLNNPGPALYHEIYLNWTTTRPGNQKEYRGTTEDLWPMISDIWESGGITGRGSNIHWSAQGINRNSEAPLFIPGDVPMQYRNCIPGDPHPGILPPTLTPTPAAMEIATLPPIEPPTLRLTKNAFCRKGPGMSFSDVTAIPAGDTVNILNISEDGFWYFIYWEKFKEKCWVAAGVGEVKGDISGLEVLVGPELPQPGQPPEPALPTEPPVVPAPCNPLVRTCP